MCPINGVTDVNARSNFHDFSTQHMALDLTIDFDRKILFGQTAIPGQEKVHGLTEIVLDTSHVVIKGWFSPSQTDDKQDPFMSSGVPEAELVFLPITDTTEQKTYKFKMEIPISNYLFAVASGNLAGEKIGSISYVYCAPGDLEACKEEFKPDLQAIIKSAENLIFEYPWPLYNLVVLPKSFHLGGMENPIFSFYSATVVSGDRENISVVAHEIAHSVKEASRRVKESTRHW
ncbi:leukotriene A-4 hydrolase [Colletotrichum salicis]|uniref:Leukotriene A-4 hydrolase n=1 Tax=Colletotrichum salicis TaxID=1209931 RepID=A0A135SFI3_9PEZI|nr:leukotriene A-4 hydrolase [Colletotrichum salicis]